jgi:HAE1 family hydrophobic/amphiphilic exporter-1
MRQTLIEGALLTVLIVFLLFLNSTTRSCRARAPIALVDGHFFFMNLFGFTINMITLMALTLSVGLRLLTRSWCETSSAMCNGQDAVPGCDGRYGWPGGAGLAVDVRRCFASVSWAASSARSSSTSSASPMVVAVLISMFVSFTLDPMLCPASGTTRLRKTHAKHAAPVTWHDKTIGRVTGWFDRVQDDLSDTTKAPALVGSNTS